MRSLRMVTCIPSSSHFKHMLGQHCPSSWELSGACGWRWLMKCEPKWLLSFYKPCLHALSFHSCLTLCGPMESNPPCSSVCAILQARILKWVAMPSSRGSSWNRDQTLVSCIAGRLFTAERPGKPSVRSRCDFKISSSHIHISEVIDMSPTNLDSSLCFIQPGILHEILRHLNFILQES